MRGQSSKGSVTKAAFLVIILLNGCSLRRPFHGSQTAYELRVVVNNGQWTTLLTNQAGYILRLMLINTGGKPATFRAIPMPNANVKCIEIDQNQKLAGGAMLYVTLDAGCELEVQVPEGGATIDLVVEHGVEKLAEAPPAI